MNFSKKDIIIGFAIILIVVFGAYFYKRSKSPKIYTLSTPVPIIFQEDIENDFKYNIPDNITAIELKGEGRGLATNKEILADIENPIAGYFYQGWVEDNDKLTSLGRLVEGKGGWMLEFPEVSDVENKKIIVSLEKVFDNKIEKRILEGSFK